MWIKAASTCDCFIRKGEDKRYIMQQVVWACVLERTAQFYNVSSFRPGATVTWTVKPKRAENPLTIFPHYWQYLYFYFKNFTCMLKSELIRFRSHLTEFAWKCANIIFSIIIIIIILWQWTQALFLGLQLTCIFIINYLVIIILMDWLNLQCTKCQKIVKNSHYTSSQPRVIYSAFLLYLATCETLYTLGLLSYIFCPSINQLYCFPNII